MLYALKRHGYILGSTVAERDGLDLVLYEDERQRVFHVKVAPKGSKGSETADAAFRTFASLEDVAAAYEVATQDEVLEVEWCHPVLGYAAL